MDLSTDAIRRLYRSSYKCLRESTATQTAAVVELETERLLEISANELLAQITAIVNGNMRACDKIGELVSLLLDYNEESEVDDPNATSINVHPNIKG